LETERKNERKDGMREKEYANRIILTSKLPIGQRLNGNILHGRVMMIY
jgi:hypothetical protein